MKNEHYRSKNKSRKCSAVPRAVAEMLPSRGQRAAAAAEQRGRATCGDHLPFFLQVGLSAATHARAALQAQTARFSSPQSVESSERERTRIFSQTLAHVKTHIRVYTQTNKLYP